MTSIRKRLTLFSSASLLLAGLVGSAGIALMPSVALADNECGPSTGTQTCTGTHTAIDYPTTTGSLTLNLANDLVVSTGGISVIGSGVDAVTIGRSTLGPANQDPVVTNTSGAGLEVVAGGVVTVNLADTTAPGIAIGGTTHGVRLETSSAGSCFFGSCSSPLTFTMTNGTVTAGSNGVGLDVLSTATGTTGGVTLNIGGLVTGGTGLRAETNGTGTLSVTLTAPSATVAGGQIVGGAGPALLLEPSAGVSLTINTGTTVRADGDDNAVIQVNDLNGTFSMNNLGALRSNDTTEAGYDDLIFAVSGGTGALTMTHGRNFIPGSCSFVCTPDSPAIGAVLDGRMDLRGTGVTTINLRGTTVWRTAGVSLLGEGRSILSVDPQAVIATAAETEFDFGDSFDSLDMRGILAVGGVGPESAATLTLTSLDLWENRGLVLFGSNADFTGSDGVANDKIIAEGIQFTSRGLGGPTSPPVGRFAMDVDLMGSQSSCETLTAADCLVLTNGTTFGATSIIINDISNGGGSITGEGILLVDVGGSGDTSIGDFIIDPATVGYVDDPELGGIIDRGLYFYGMRFDADAQQHLIVGMPKLEVMQLSTLGNSAQTMWRMSTATWFERQADVRRTMDEGMDYSPGVWLRAVGGSTDRTIDQTGPLFTFDALTGFDQNRIGLIGGVDLVAAAGEGRAYVIGLTAGYSTADTTFKRSHAESTMSGHNFGAYGSFATDLFFVDGVVNANWMDVDYDAPSLGLTGATGVGGRLESKGAHVEGGFRLPINDGDAFLEPLAALSYVTTDVSDFNLSGGVLEAEDLVSFRGSLGARVSGELALDAFAVKMGLTARRWEEFEGENRLSVNADGTVIPLLDDVSGAFNEIGIDLALFSNGSWRNLSVLLNAGMEFADDYKNSTASLGFRFQW